MKLAARSESWNKSIVLSEAGIEDGLMLINKYSCTTTPRGAWASNAIPDSWISLGTNLHYIRRYVQSNYYDVYITNNPATDQPTIKSVGYIRGSDSTEVRRTIIVIATPGSMFQGGLVAKAGVSLNGNVVVDSYNSQDPLYSTNGQYIASLRNHNGNIATALSNVTAAVSVGGSVEVYGKIATGPGDTINVLGGGSVGSETWVDSGNNGIEPGWSSSDLNIYIPDAPAPPSGGLTLPSKVANTFQGTNYPDSYLLSAGNYQQSANLSLASSDTILVSGHVKLYFTEDFSMAGQSKIIIGTNSSLTIFAGGDVDLNGGGAVNSTGFATNLTLYGLSTCENIHYTGGSDFTGTIYAPHADFVMSGGGGTIYNLNGSAVAKSVTLQGKYQVHYDESLSALSAGAHYYISSWQEVPN